MRFLNDDNAGLEENLEEEAAGDQASEVYSSDEGEVSVFADDARKCASYRSGLRPDISL